MIIFVDNEHANGYEQSWGEMLLAARVRIKYRLEDITGKPCLIVRYNHVTPELLHRLNARAVFISGNGSDEDLYTEADRAGIRAAIREMSWPMFGFCGGFQLMAQSYGAPLELIGPLPPGTEDPYPDFAPGRQKEFGYQPVHITKQHSMLTGLGQNPVMRQAHSWEIKSLPQGFTNYAVTDVTPIQLMIHDKLPIVGTQFHPEYFTDAHPGGRVLIENFCKMAGLIG